METNGYSCDFVDMWVPTVKTGEKKAFCGNGRGYKGKDVPIQTVKT
jgi:hypothetical protein